MALRVRGLRVRLGGHDVLHGVDLEVPAGSVTAVLGPSGCGKTTLLRTIAGFQAPSHGSVRIAGRVVAAATDSVIEQHVAVPDRKVGVVPQEGALFPHLDVIGNVGFGLPRGRGERTQTRDRIEEMLRLVGLPGFGRRRVHELSGGQQQRVALARALAPEPQLVLLDEPFSALDAALREELRMEVAAALRIAGATAVMVTHDRAEALSMADQVAVMQDGLVRQSGTPEELYHDPVDLTVAWGTGDITLLAATLEPDAYWVSTAAGRIRLSPRSVDRARVAGLGGADLRVVGLRGGDTSGGVAVMLRPEQVVLHPMGGATGDEQSPWPRGVVLECRFHGHDSVVVVEVGGHRVRSRSIRSWQVGQQVLVQVEGVAQLVDDLGDHPAKT